MMDSEQRHRHALRIAREAIESIEFLTIAEDDEIAEAMDGFTDEDIEATWADIHMIATRYTEVRIIPSRKIRND